MGRVLRASLGSRRSVNVSGYSPRSTRRMPTPTRRSQTPIRRALIATRRAPSVTRSLPIGTRRRAIATSRPARIRVSTRSPVPSVSAPPISVSRPPGRVWIPPATATAPRTPATSSRSRETKPPTPAICRVHDRRNRAADVAEPPIEVRAVSTVDASVLDSRWWRASQKRAPNERSTTAVARSALRFVRFPR